MSVIVSVPVPDGSLTSDEIDAWMRDAEFNACALRSYSALHRMYERLVGDSTERAHVESTFRNLRSCLSKEHEAQHAAAMEQVRQRAVVELRAEYQSLAGELRVELATIGSERDQLRLRLDEAQRERAAMESRFKEELEAHKATETALRDSLRTESKMNTTAKGLEGQDFVELAVRKAFNFQCEVIGVNNTPHAMDIRATTADGANLLVEVKHERRVTADDVKKFWADVQTAKAGAMVDMALMVSIATHIPHHRNGQVEYVSLENGMRVPIMFLANDTGGMRLTSDRVEQAIVSLHQLQQLCKESHIKDGEMPIGEELEQRRKDQLILRAELPFVFDSISNMEAGWRMQLQAAETMQRRASEELSRLQRLRHSRQRMENEFEWMHATDSVSDVRLTQAIGIVREYRTKHGRFPTLEQLAETSEIEAQLVRAAGGITKVKGLIRNKRVASNSLEGDVDE